MKARCDEIGLDLVSASCQRSDLAPVGLRRIHYNKPLAVGFSDTAITAPPKGNMPPLFRDDAWPAPLSMFRWCFTAARCIKPFLAPLCAPRNVALALRGLTFAACGRTNMVYSFSYDLSDGSGKTECAQGDTAGDNSSLRWWYWSALEALPVVTDIRQQACTRSGNPRGS